MNKISLFFAAWLLILFTGLLTSCNSVYTPKKRGYFRIAFPHHDYQQFEKPGYPYSFEYPLYAQVVKDSSFFEAKAPNPYWINVEFPQFHAVIYISYYQIGATSFEKLKDDAFKMTYKHTLKANSIDYSLINTPLGVSGIFFNVGGNAATAKQFFVSDSVRHFLRGALYFDSTPNEDSLGIVNDFLEGDMEHLINTLRWKTP